MAVQRADSVFQSIFVKEKVPGMWGYVGDWLPSLSPGDKESSEVERNTM